MKEVGIYLSPRDWSEVLAALDARYQYCMKEGARPRTAAGSRHIYFEAADTADRIRRAIVTQLPPDV